MESEVTWFGEQSVQRIGRILTKSTSQKWQSNHYVEFNGESNHYSNIPLWWRGLWHTLEQHEARRALGCMHGQGCEGRCGGCRYTASVRRCCYFRAGRTSWQCLLTHRLSPWWLNPLSQLAENVKWCNLCAVTITWSLAHAVSFLIIQSDTYTCTSKYLPSCQQCSIEQCNDKLNPWAHKRSDGADEGCEFDRRHIALNAAVYRLAWRHLPNREPQYLL